MNANKDRGSRLERELVIKAKLLGIKAVRAWGSNGRSLGLHEEVDVLLNDIIKVQCKSRKKIATHIIPNNNVDIQVIKGKNQGIFAVLPIETYLRLIKMEDKKKEAIILALSDAHAFNKLDLQLIDMIAHVFRETVETIKEIAHEEGITYNIE